MKIHKGTAAALVVLVLGIAALAAWGEQLGMSEGSLRWVQGAAGCVGALVMALLPKLFHDGNGDGIPDIVQRGSMLLVLALAAGPVLVGCTGDALSINAGLASTMADVVNEGCGAVEHERDAEQHAALDAHETREAAAAAVAAVRDRWDAFIFACQLAARAQLAWAGYLAGLASSGGEFRLQLALPFVVGAVHAYEDFAALDPPLPDDVHLPAVPGAILSLLDALTPTEGAE